MPARAMMSRSRGLLALCILVALASAVLHGAAATATRAAAAAAAPSPRLQSSLAAYLQRASPFTAPSAAASFDPDESLQEPPSAIGRSLLEAHSVSGKLYAMRRRSDLLRKFGRLAPHSSAVLDEAAEVSSLRALNPLPESVNVDASDIESDVALLERAPWRRQSPNPAAWSEEAVDEEEWRLATEQAQLHARDNSQHAQVQFSAHSPRGIEVEGALNPLDDPNAYGYGALVESSVSADPNSASDMMSSPRKDESRQRTKTADLHLPSSQLAQIIVWTKQHIVWLVDSLGDHLPPEAVAAFPKPTRNELYGYVYSLFIDPQNPASWVDSLSNDFDDMLLLQVWQYKTFANFFDWIQISTVLFSLREETNFPLSPIQKRRLWARYTGLFREDINLLNLGEEGELRRYLSWKWQLEYVGEVLSEANTEEYLTHLLRLQGRLRARGIREGLIKYYRALFIEKLAKFRLDYTYDAAQEYWGNTHRAMATAMAHAQVTMDTHNAERLQRVGSPTSVVFNPETSGMTAAALSQAADAGVPAHIPFDPFTLPLNIVAMIESDLNRLQGTAIASISNYLEWHAKTHGNSQQDGADVPADHLNDGQYMSDPESAAGRAAVDSTPVPNIANPAAARARGQVASSPPASSSQRASSSFRDVSMDSDFTSFGSLMPGLVEKSSTVHDAGMPTSQRVGALLEAQQAERRARLARREEEARQREAIQAKFEDFRAQKEAPETCGREKHFLRHKGVDLRGIPQVQPLSVDTHRDRQSDRSHSPLSFSTVVSAPSGVTPVVDASCTPISVASMRAQTDVLRNELQSQVDSCIECAAELRAAHASSIASLLAAILPSMPAAAADTDVLPSGVDSCMLVALRARVHSAVATVLFTQIRFLQPYYSARAGGDSSAQSRLLSSAEAVDDVEFLYVFAVQVAQNHLHKDAQLPQEPVSGPAALDLPELPHLREWCTLLLQLCNSHPRTRPDHAEAFAWRALLGPVHEILGWGWYESPRTAANVHQQKRDLRLRHKTHVAPAVDGIIRTEMLLESLNAPQQFASVSNVPNHTGASAGARAHSSGGRTLMAATLEPGSFDEYANAYSDGYAFISSGDVDDASLLEAPGVDLSPRAQLRLLLRRANVTETLFDVDGFISENIPAAFEVLIENLIRRLTHVFSAFRTDNTKVWHSDRSKAPSASYDFDHSIREIDFLVWLDSMCYNAAGHLNLDRLAVYSAEGVAMINKKVSADDKYTRETQLRNQVDPAIWLKHVSAFERWRWSWAHPDSKRLLNHNEKIVFTWLEGWGGTDNLRLGALIACVSSSIWAALQIVRYLITKPWQRSALVRNGSIHYEQKYHEEYERRERSIVLWRVLPVSIFTTFIGNFMMCTFVLALNFTYYNWVAMFFYLAIFRWLTSVIFDVYALKFFMYLVLFLFPKQRTGDMKPPLCACSIPLSSACVVFNPLRPANDDQLRQAVRKQIDMLWGASSSHIISILILQAEGNLTSTFRRYEAIIRQLLYDDPDVPQHVKDRFFVFQVAEVTKPHNMYKVCHWLFMRSEQYDPVTRDFLFGLDTSARIERSRKALRRAPVGRLLPPFATLGGLRPGLPDAHHMDARGIELIDDKDMADADAERQIEDDIAKARQEKKMRGQQLRLGDPDSGEAADGSADSGAADAKGAAVLQDSASLLRTANISSMMNRWAFAVTGGPESSFEAPEEALPAGENAPLVSGVEDSEPARQERISNKNEKIAARRAAKEAKRKAREAALDAQAEAGAHKKVDPLLPNAADDVDNLRRVTVEDASDDEADDEATEDEDDLADPDDETEAAMTALNMPRTVFHSTYEPLVYLGGQLNYKGYEECGADAGIICTVQGLRNLLYLRNENKPGEPLLENFAVLDADNYVEPVTLLRMLATMTDDYMIWQPCIKFYNRHQSSYAYMKDFTNEHLGHFMNIANVWMYGGIRSFGKYFGRLKRFYYEECTAASCGTAPEQYSFMFNIASGLITLTMMLYCIRPLGQEYMYVGFVVSPLFTIALCAYIWWTHGALRKLAHEVSASTDPDIGRGEELIGFGPIQGDDVAADLFQSDKARKVLLGEARASVSDAAGNKVINRFQNMFPLNRLFIQSEDARHGGPFGRAVYLMDDCIHEATPISPLDDNQREFNKWLPTFDMRDFILLHTPMLWILDHITLSVWIAGLCSISSLFTFVYTVMFVNMPSSLIQVLCFCVFMASTGLCYAFWSLRGAMSEPVRHALRASRFPEMPERAQYNEDLMIRGIWSETIWLMQFALGIFCLLVPGTVEIAYPFLGEFHLLILLILLIHPKFTAPLLTRLHYIFHPKWKGYWRSRAAVQAANENAKQKGIKILMKKGGSHLIANVGGAAAVAAAAEEARKAAEAEGLSVCVDDDGNQVLARKTKKALTVDALYEMSKTNNLNHTCLFETGSFNVCGRNLPKWNHDASLEQGEKYSKLKDEDGFTRDTRFLFRLPNLEECGEKLEISWEALERKQRKIAHWMAVQKTQREAEAAAEEEAKKAGTWVAKPALGAKAHMVAFPLGADGLRDTETRADKRDEVADALAAITAAAENDLPDEDVQKLPSAAPKPAPKPQPTLVDMSTSSSSSTSSASSSSKVPFPLEGPTTEEQAEILDAQRALHQRYLRMRAATWMERQYIIFREKRWQPILQLSLLWLLHDIPVGIFEFTASTTVFGLKLLTKPPQVIWAMIGCCMEIKGLLLGVPTPGTWPSFVESTQTLPLSLYIQEYHVPMGLSVILFFLCIPSLPSLFSQSALFTNPFYLLLIGAAFGSLLGLLPAYNSFMKLRVVVRNRAAGGWSQLRQLRWLREVWSMCVSLLLFILILTFAFSSWLLRGSFPAVFFIRSFPILIASFVLGPGIAWLLGMSHGVFDGTTNPPRYRRAWLSMALCVGVGDFILACAGMFIFALSVVLLPLQKMMGGAAGGGAEHNMYSTGSLPTGDGSAPVMLPVSLSYGEMIKAPWYFLIPYAAIVYGSLLLAALAWPSALFHQAWTWWFYHCTKQGAERDRVVAYNVDDLKHQNLLKEKRGRLQSLQKAGASRDLVRKLAQEAVAEAAAQQGRVKAATSTGVTTLVDAPIIDAPAGAGVRAQKVGRRGAVTLGI